MNRREFVNSCSAALSIASFGFSSSVIGAAENADIISGAIRWDAWYQRKDASLSAQSSLSARRYFKRAPFFCTVDDTYRISCDGSAEEMEIEIDAAVRGGLKYWAFDWYASNSSLRTAWTLYSKSHSRERINWCGIVNPSNLGSMPFRSNNWHENAREWCAHMAQSNYQKVTLDGASHPLLYLLWDASQVKWYFDGDVENVKVFFAFLQDLLHEAQEGSPYVVLLDSHDAANIARHIGANAISSYIAEHRGAIKGSYASLAAQAEEYWVKIASSGIPMVPIAQVGWDTRPRQEKPVPWEPSSPNPEPLRYYEAPTPAEFRAHLKAATNYVHTNISICPSRIILIYSWDECDEGGGLIPSLGDPSGTLLSALGDVLS